MKLILAVVGLMCAVHSPFLFADTFGNGDSTFDMEFVNIGQPRNPADTTGAPNPAGQVDYAYRIGKFEVSEDMINKANELGGLGITHGNLEANKPATFVSWFEAAKFVNWLNVSRGGQPAYKFDSGGNFQLWTASDSGYDPNNRYRNRSARYFLPSVNEWYKAAFYDPVAGVYYDYPTGSNAAPDGIDFAGDTSFDAVFFDGGANLQPNDITNVGSLSPYGTGGQGANVHEWEETDLDLINDSTTSPRGRRGGDWFATSLSILASSRRDGDNPALGFMNMGFRVASVPEPSTLLLALAGFSLLGIRRR